MKMVLAIAAGGAVGAVARHAVMSAIFHATGPGFPWGTLAVNVLGSFLLGCMAEYFALRGAVPQPVQALLVVGMMGAFTTFSTFALDVHKLVLGQTLWPVAGYVGGSVILACGGLVAGLYLMRWVLA